jgi:integrase
VEPTDHVTDHANALLMLADVLDVRDPGEPAAAARHEAIVKLRAKGKVHLGEPKTAAGRRTVMLPAFVLDALKRAKAEQNKRRLLIGADWVERNLVVDRGDGDYWIPPSFSTGWRRFAAKAGFLDVPLLGLRHGSATLMLAAGVPDPVAAQIMGHADTRILRRYQDVVPELKREAASKMGELLGG